MKTKLLSLLSLALLLVQFGFAQTSTKGFSFQGYAIDPDGKALGNTQVTVKFTLSSASNVSTPFTEEHALTTDAFGIFHAIIGNSSAAKNAEFSKLDFTKKGDDDYTLKVEVKKTVGGTYTTISNEPLAAVPYARKAENGVPVGTIVAFAGPKANIPSGWLYCDGSAISRTTYAQLFAAIGTSWGYGDQSTTFNIPYLLGMHLRGVDDGRTLDENAGSRSENAPGGNTGDNVGSVEWDQIRSHSHSAWSDPAGNHAHNYTSPMIGSYEIQSNTTPNNRTKEYPTNNGGTTTTNGNHTHPIGIAASGGAENQVDNAYVYYIIKY